MLASEKLGIPIAIWFKLQHNQTWRRCCHAPAWKQGKPKCATNKAPVDLVLEGGHYTGFAPPKATKVREAWLREGACLKHYKSWQVLHQSDLGRSVNLTPPLRFTQCSPNQMPPRPCALWLDNQNRRMRKLSMVGLQPLAMRQAAVPRFKTENSSLV